MKKKTPEHLEDYRWKPGQSGNPSGKKTGLARAARDAVGEDGNALAELWLSIALDDTRRDSDRLEASKMLAERGWGKAVTFTAQEGDPLGLEDAEQAAEEFRRNILRLAPRTDEGQAAGGGEPAEPAQP